MGLKMAVAAPWHNQSNEMKANLMVTIKEIKQRGLARIIFIQAFIKKNGTES